MAFERKLFLDIFARDRGASKTMRDVGDSTDDVNTSVTELTESSSALEKQLDQTRGSLRKLLEEAERTGGNDVLFKSIRQTRREKSFLESAVKQLEELRQPAADEGTVIGEVISDAAVQGMRTGFKVGGPQLIAGLAALVAASAPFIGGVAAAGVIGGVGAGGLVGGIVAAAQDARVKDAGIKLGETALTAFSGAAEPFVEPVIRSIQRLEVAAEDTASRLEPTFKSISALVMPLTEGLIGLVTKALPGLAFGMEQSKPLFRFIASELPKLGAEIGDFIAIIAEDPDGAILAMRSLFEITKATLSTTGALIANLERTFEWSVRTSASVSGALEDAFAWAGPAGIALGELFGVANDQAEDALKSLDDANEAGDGFAGSLDDVGDSATKAAEDLLTLKEAFDLLFGIQMGVDEATLRFHKSLRVLREELHDGAHELKLTTEAGQENRDTVYSHIQAIEALRTANINNNMAVEDANRIYDQQLVQLQDTLIKLGFNRREVEQLVAAYRQIPGRVSSQVVIEGMEGAIARTRELARLLGTVAAGANAARNGEYISGRASGGPVRAGTTYMVGEEGPELVRFDQNGYVVNAQDTAAMMGSPSPWAPGGGSGGPMMVTIIFPPSGDPITDSVVAGLRERVRVESGGDVTLFFESPQ